MKKSDGKNIDLIKVIRENTSNVINKYGIKVKENNMKHITNITTPVIAKKTTLLMKKIPKN